MTWRLSLRRGIGFFEFPRSSLVRRGQELPERSLLMHVLGCKQPE